MNTTNNKGFYNSYMVRDWKDISMAVIKVTPKGGTTAKRPRADKESPRVLPPPANAQKGAAAAQAQNQGWG
eukprot:15890167-Heterocapsa_arctica.AAC.1